MEKLNLEYQQKYNAVIIRLIYAMSPYFKVLDDINEDEVINTACDNLARYYDKNIEELEESIIKKEDIYEQFKNQSIY